jgi:hypothetical protein
MIQFQAFPLPAGQGPFKPSIPPMRHLDHWDTQQPGSEPGDDLRLHHHQLLPGKGAFTRLILKCDFALRFYAL